MHVKQIASRPGRRRRSDNEPLQPTSLIAEPEKRAAKSGIETEVERQLKDSENASVSEMIHMAEKV